MKYETHFMRTHDCQKNTKGIYVENMHGSVGVIIQSIFAISF